MSSRQALGIPVERGDRRLGGYRSRRRRGSLATVVVVALLTISKDSDYALPHTQHQRSAEPRALSAVVKRLRRAIATTRAALHDICSTRRTRPASSGFTRPCGSPRWNGQVGPANEGIRWCLAVVEASTLLSRAPGVVAPSVRKKARGLRSRESVFFATVVQRNVSTLPRDA